MVMAYCLLPLGWLFGWYVGILGMVSMVGMWWWAYRPLHVTPRGGRARTHSHTRPSAAPTPHTPHTQLEPASNTDISKRSNTKQVSVSVTQFTQKWQSCILCKYPKIFQVTKKHSHSNHTVIISDQ